MCLWNWNLGIFWDTLWLNCFTYFLVYLRKASLDHRLIIVMLWTGHLPRYINIAAPDLIECVHVSSFLIHRISSPIETNADRKADAISFKVVCSIRLYLHTAKTNVLSVSHGYPFTLWTVASHLRTGHKIISPDATYVLLCPLSCLSFTTRRLSTRTLSILAMGCCGFVLFLVWRIGCFSIGGHQFGLSFSRKVCATYEMVLLIVLST